MKQLETCKKHGGPLTPNCIDSVEHLNTCELLAEVSYLRSTTAPNIRQMRREKCQSGGYKMKKFADKELRTSIRNAISPKEEVTADIEEFLNAVL